MTLARRCSWALSMSIAAAPSLAAAQQLGGAEGFEPPLLRLALGLLLCTFVALIAALAMRRFIRTGSLGPVGGLSTLLRPAPRKLRVIESHRLSPHADACVFVCDGREYLVIVSTSGATVLREHTGGAETSS